MVKRHSPITYWRATTGIRIRCLKVILRPSKEFAVDSCHQQRLVGNHTSCYPKLSVDAPASALVSQSGAIILIRTAENPA